MAFNRHTQRIFTIIAGTLVGITSCAFAGSPADEAAANSALQALHKLAVNGASLERATKDGDRRGCKVYSASLESNAHDALVNLHRISNEPISAIRSVSQILRMSNLKDNECPYDNIARGGLLTLVAGQAIEGLRVDFAISDFEWEMVTEDGAIEKKDPLKFATSLQNQNYSWVIIGPKGAFSFGITDWNAELASNNVSDSSIENSGNNVKAVEVAYRKMSGDENKYVYFFRSPDDARAAADEIKQQSARNKNSKQNRSKRR